MKKLLTCASIAAVGATSLQAQYLGGSAEKPWSVSARLRGFFDDNYATYPAKRNDGGPIKRSSWGADLGVSGSYNPRISEVTTLGLSVGYDAYYFEDRRRGAVDHQIQATVSLGHQIGEKFKIDASDNFVVAQEPHLLQPAGTMAIPYRTEGSNVRNTANLAGTAQLAEKLSTRVGYSNTIYDFEEDGPGKRSALLDRMEHLASADLRWQFRPTTTGLVGYQLGYIDHSSKDPLWDPQITLATALVQEYTVAVGTVTSLMQKYGITSAPGYVDSNGNGVPDRPEVVAGLVAVGFSNADADLWFDEMSKLQIAGGVATLNAATVATVTARVNAAFAANPVPTAEIRNNRSHYFFVGVDHSFTPKLTGQLRVGMQYTEYPEALPGMNDSNTIPYVDASVRYGYAEGCMAQVGVRHTRLQTDVAIVALHNPADPQATLDTESTTFYGSVMQKITARLKAIVKGQFQMWTFNQGTYDKEVDMFYYLDAGLEYEINKFLFAEAGYGFDKLDSDLPNRGYSRNRLYFGVRGTY